MMNSEVINKQGNKDNFGWYCEGSECQRHSKSLGVQVGEGTVVGLVGQGKGERHALRLERRRGWLMQDTLSHVSMGR